MGPSLLQTDYTICALRTEQKNTGGQVSLCCVNLCDWTLLQALLMGLLILL